MMMVSVKTFENGAFGKLSSLRSEKTGKIMFIAKEVCDMWGHTNATQAIKSAKLNSEEVMSIKKSDYPDFFREIATNFNLVANKTNQIQLVTESGLYKLALNSKKKEADQLKHWLATDVLPSLRKTGKYVMGAAVTNIGDHQIVSIQKGNSKDVNAVNYQNGGVVNIIEYNTKSCYAMTAKTPKEIKSLGLSVGLKKSECSSAKEVLRRIRPEVACTMSFIDNAVKQGQSFDKFVEIGKKYAAPLFKAMLETGMRPGELSM